jgi:1-deoxy-D-xylulose-5-phosphate reductoisomerase
MKKIAVLGSTGSIGCSTLHLVRQNPHLFSVQCLAAQNNWQLLLQQAIEFQPEVIVIENEKYFSCLKKDTPHNIKVLAGKQAIIDVLATKYNLVVLAIVGIAGLLPTITAIKAGNDIALANKESLVCAGNLITSLAKTHNVKILPLDSEHNALWQIFQNNHHNIESVVLTASGGPFLNFTGDIKQITKQQAIQHPNWQMGAKISVDSATMVNKGLEVIEAYYLFPHLQISQIEVLIHPQSIVHGIVNYIDGASIALLSKPNMQIPISYALNFPHRILQPQQKLTLSQLTTLQFLAIDEKKYPAFKLCQQALQHQGSALIALNASNEVAVTSFLQEKLAFWQIPLVIEKTLNSIKINNYSCLNEILAINQQCFLIATQIINTLS